MEGFKKGMLAKSKAGHDAGRVYVIIDTVDAYVYLADGRLRTLGRLKKKKKKHVQLICKEHDLTGITDAHIRHLLKNWNKEEEMQKIGGSIECQRLT